jgi:hypothetical protein
LTCPPYAEIDRGSQLLTFALVRTQILFAARNRTPNPLTKEKPAKVASTKILRMLLARDATLVTGRRHVHRDHLELGFDEAKRSFHRRRL